MSRSSWAATSGVVLTGLLLVIGLLIPAPFVSIGRGPTYDTLGQVGGENVVAVRSLPTYPTSGHLNMTTVSVADGLTVAETLARWMSSDYLVAPRSSLFPPGQSAEQITARNRADFADSQASAEGAAFLQLGLPTVAVVEQIVAEGSAQGVLEPGDTVLTIGGTPVTTPEGVSQALAGTRPGQQVTLGIRRGDDLATRDVVVTLGTLPGREQGALGIVPGARPADRGEVTISLGDVGGPSAGLMFSLAVYDKLTPGALTGGRFVAGTGTITSTGVVGPIEGIRFKMLAAREAGATAFLVPAGNCDDVVGNVPDGLTTARIATLPEAITAVEALARGQNPPTC